MAKTRRLGHYHIFTLILIYLIIFNFLHTLHSIFLSVIERILRHFNTFIECYRTCSVAIFALFYSHYDCIYAQISGDIYPSIYEMTVLIFFHNHYKSFNDVNKFRCFRKNISRGFDRKKNLMNVHNFAKIIDILLRLHPLF